jgi:prolyl-tRNA synthetase
MRYSKLFGKTTFGDQKASKFVSHVLLTKGGFVRESTAGRYYYLPLGWRVHEKIKAIVKDEMDRAGAQEMITPILHPISLWKETRRTESVGFELMSVEDRSGARFVLGGTAEEMFADLVRKFKLSYRDLPFTLYQFSTKFRDELRARGGLLRVREFVMKDAYSFHRDADDFRVEYEALADTYTRIFRRVGLDAVRVEADNGYIGGEYSHEFIVESEVGESRYFESEDGRYHAHEDVAKFRREAVNPDEPVKPFQIIAQPEWVHTMEDNVKHYGLPPSHYLKNVVYRNVTTGEIIIATIRGDLDVNKVKLEHVIDAVGQLEDATDEDLARIGTKRGYVHCWGHTGVRYIGDYSLQTVRNFIGGQKEVETDSINVNYGRDFECERLADIAMAQDGYLTEDGQRLIEKRGIEVGNIFQLGYHYSAKMEGATFVDQDGKEKPYYMGCYGIGIGRTLAAIVEKYHDDRGILWPEAVAPFQAHLVSLGDGEKAEAVYNRLREAGIDVLWDDRSEPAGVKFTDADLIGAPIRLVVSERNKDKIEWKPRAAVGRESAELLSLDEVLARLCGRS